MQLANQVLLLFHLAVLLYPSLKSFTDVHTVCLKNICCLIFPV